MTNYGEKRGGGDRGAGGERGGREADEPDDDMHQGDGEYLMPDRDFYRKKITSFQSVHSYFESKPLQRSFRERQLLQPHYTALMNRGAPYASAINGQVADGVCAHFLRKGFTKPTKTHFNCALWTSDAKWLVLGTEYGDLATWEGESLKVKKMLSMAPHKVGTGTGPIANTSITAIAKNRHGRMLVTGDANGLYQFCDETFRTSFIKEEAHNGAIHGLSFSPSDSKLVSAGEDAAIHVWTVGQSVPDTTLHGHQSDIKCIEWHPFRSLVASGSRDSAVRLWDPRANGSCVSILTAHKKQVNCLGWNALNGNWLATGAKDGLLKVFDIRKMKPMEVHRGHNCDVTGIGWHPQHESLLLTGGYNGSLCYWTVGKGSGEEPHTAIAGAHRQFIDVIAWHPEGHICATASNDCILKFWGREPPGSRLDIDEKEMMGSNFLFGPIPPGTPSNIAPPVLASTQLDIRNTAGLVDVRDMRQGGGSSGGAPLPSAPAAPAAPAAPLSAAQNLAQIQAQVAARMAAQRPAAPPVPTLAVPPQINIAALPSPAAAAPPVPGNGGGIYGPASSSSTAAPGKPSGVPAKDPRKRRRT
jgi:polyadenylation factor subunit 2